jgi:hypothetical protein
VPGTFEAAVVVLFAVLPGAMFTGGLELLTGTWYVDAAARVLRFVVFSALLNLALVPWVYMLYRDYILSGHLVHAKPFPWPVFLGLLAYFGLLPLLLGLLCGVLINRGNPAVSRAVSGLLGRNPDPVRAFDYLFRRRQPGYVRMVVSLPSGAAWIAGAFTDEGSKRAFVASYPEEPDIFLPVRVGCDPQTGAFQFDAAGNLVVEDVGVLVNGSKVAYLEFIDG